MKVPLAGLLLRATDPICVPLKVKVASGGTQGFAASLKAE